MGAVHYTGPVVSGGVPLMGNGARYTSWWGVTTYFVDYDHGSDSYNGKEPTKAVKNLQTALNRMSGGDVVYIRNRDQDITSTDGEAILPQGTSNWTTAESKPHISIIGASNLSHLSYQAAGYAVILKGTATSNTTAVLDVQSGFTLIENLGFHRGGSTSGGLIALTGNSTSLRALGSAVNNCLFRLYSNNSHAGIYNVDNWFTSIYGCDFHDCNAGVEYVGSSSTVRRNRLANCIFRNQTAASVSTNIIFKGSSGQDNTISDCDFMGEVPTATDHGDVTTAGCIIALSAIQGNVVRCTFMDDTVEGTAAAAIQDNGLGMVACDQALWTADQGRGGVEGA